MDLDEIERLIKDSKIPGAPVSGATVLALIAEVRALRELCAATYQMAGVVNAPERFLDALSDAANGEIGSRASTDALLPVDASECGAFPAESGDEVRALREDKARLDYLDCMNTQLNKFYDTTYQWKVILSPNIVRLTAGRQWAGYVGDIDLNDAQCGEGSFESCRKAIDDARGGK
jgi:hypothetical protein